MTKQNSIIIGLSMVVPVEAGANESRFSIVSANPGIAWRLNNETGAISSCRFGIEHKPTCSPWGK